VTITSSTTSQIWTRDMIDVAGSTIEVMKGGSGEPLLILHGELGNHGWLPYHEGLSQNSSLIVPSHPGFGASPRLEWIMNMRDLAGWYLRALDEMNIGPINVIGHSLGGWLAAEMATMNPQQFKKMVLVGPAGIKPPEGEIFDMFLVIAKEYMEECLLDPAGTAEFHQIFPEEQTPEQIETLEIAREEACRLSWKPYMHYPALPQLLGRVKNLPTMIVWGRQDSVIPLSAAEVYNRSIQGSELAIIDNCGHLPEIEKPEEFETLVQKFLAIKAK
jgi:pimeloyl-ACP methyl ester carboxylesterase